MKRPDVEHALNLAENASPGPWKINCKNPLLLNCFYSHPLCELSDPFHRQTHTGTGEDGEFITASRDLLPALCNYIVALEKRPNLINFFMEQRHWSLETFGPGTRLDAVLDHLKKEIKEIATNPSDVYEWVDVIFLCVDGAMRQGHTPEQVWQAMLKKQEINFNRSWPSPSEQAADKAVEHVRGGA